MNIKNRKAALQKLAQDAKLEKIASDIQKDTNLAQEENPEEYAHKVFLKLLENLHIEELD